MELFKIEKELILWNLIAFGILLFIIKQIIWPKMYVFIETRRRKIDDLLKMYDARNAEVARLVDRMKTESEKAAERRNKFIEEAQKESYRVKQDIIEKAYNEATSVVEKARAEMATERRRLFDDVRKNISTIVVRSIEQILANVIDDDLDKKIISETEKVVNLGE